MDKGVVAVDNPKVSWKAKLQAFVALVAYAAASNGAIPTQYQGIWAEVNGRTGKEQCAGRWPSEGPMYITATHVEAGERHCSAKSVAGDGEAIVVTADCAQEGESFTSSFRLTVSDNELLMTYLDRSPQRAFKFLRCSPSEPANLPRGRKPADDASAKSPRAAGTGTPTRPTVAAEEVRWMLGAAQSGDEAEVQRLKSQLEGTAKPARSNRAAARALHDAGLKLLRSGDMASATDQFAKAAGLDRGDAEILGNLGFALLMSGQPDEARAALEGALMLAPGRSASWGNLGEAYAGLGDEVSALAAFRLTYLFSRNKDKTIAYFDMLISKPGAPTALVSAAKTAKETPTVSPPAPSAPGRSSQAGVSSGQLAAGDTIGYGSRAGMEVTVVSAAGLDTARAVIRTKHTRKNAIAFCRDYVQKVTEACIAETLAIPLNEEIAGNCQTGEFVDFSGARFRFEGPAPKGGSDYLPDYRLRILETGELADGSMASGYPVNLEIFRALCPSVGRGTFPQGSAAHTPGSSTPVAAANLDQIRRHYSKSVNFPKAYAGRLLTVTGMAAATNPRSGYRVKIEVPRRGGEDVTAWCLTTTGAMAVGAPVMASGTLVDPVYTNDEGGEAFYLKDCTLKPAG